MDPIVFIHFPVEGHMGCGHPVATVNSNAVNTGVQGPECLLSILSRLHPEVGWLTLAVLSDCLRSRQSLSTAAAPFALPTSSP